MLVFVNPAVGRELRLSKAGQSFTVQPQFSAECVCVPLELIVQNPQVCMHFNSGHLLLYLCPYG